MYLQDSGWLLEGWFGHNESLAHSQTLWLLHPQQYKIARHRRKRNCLSHLLSMSFSPDNTTRPFPLSLLLSSLANAAGIAHLQPWFSLSSLISAISPYFISHCHYHRTNNGSGLSSLSLMEVEAIFTHLYSIHHKIVNVCLHLVDYPLMNYLLSNLIQSLRTSARMLLDVTSLLGPLNIFQFRSNSSSRTAENNNSDSSNVTRPWVQSSRFSVKKRRLSVMHVWCSLQKVGVMDMWLICTCSWTPTKMKRRMWSIAQRRMHQLQW